MVEVRGEVFDRAMARGLFFFWVDAPTYAAGNEIECAFRDRWVRSGWKGGGRGSGGGGQACFMLHVSFRSHLPTTEQPR